MKLVKKKLLIPLFVVLALLTVGTVLFLTFNNTDVEEILPEEFSPILEVCSPSDQGKKIIRCRSLLRKDSANENCYKLSIIDSKFNLIDYDLCNGEIPLQIENDVYFSEGKNTVVYSDFLLNTSITGPAQIEEISFVQFTDKEINDLTNEWFEVNYSTIPDILTLELKEIYDRGYYTSKTLIIDDNKYLGTVVFVGSKLLEYSLEDGLLNTTVSVNYKGEESQVEINGKDVLMMDGTFSDVTLSDLEDIYENETPINLTLVYIEEEMEINEEEIEGFCSSEKANVIIEYSPICAVLGDIGIDSLIIEDIDTYLEQNLIGTSENLVNLEKLKLIQVMEE
jgi:ssRNA-specific RNase YbeY (16S rRNA maturation enzyme)